ncbi:uncharacterized protein LOC116261198 [Nymphaea colorata]|uniref:Oxidoreductase-like domain-containing protein n=1 Tax=Nymphaea colorata TaxID=210225 RepID=A0A5K1H018_9MAGN|nr:uncharacterized protein LOC116261198 [Nymphaea colorata]
MLRRGICGKRIVGADVHRGLGLLRHGNGENRGMEVEIMKDKTEKGPEKKKDVGSTKMFDSPPEKPLPGDCCGGGCNPCVWDTYYEQLEEYNNSRSGDGNEQHQPTS